MPEIAKYNMGTATDYLRDELMAASNSYFAENGVVRGKWNGLLAAELGLSGYVTEEQYMRLIQGQHPLTGEQLVKHRHTKLTEQNLEASHVPCWDVHYGIPKSWSIAAVVGGDKRIYEWFDTAVADGNKALEVYAQAHGGGNNPNITTGRWIMASFRHETARPVNGYSAEQIHQHNLLMNIQKVGDRWRALDPDAIFKARSYAHQAFYDSLARSARAGGYEIDFMESTYAPEIRGVSEEYRKHESPRREAILEESERLGVTSGKALKLIAERNREEKLKLTPEQFIAMQTEHGRPFADELKVVPEALARGPVHMERVATPEAAIAHAARKISERHETFEHYELAREALRYSLGTVPRDDIEDEIQKQLTRRKLVPVHHYREYAPGARYTTSESLHIACDTVKGVLQGMNTVEPILENADLSRYPELADNPQRQQILRDILATRDQVVAINGVAGGAKSTACVILKDIAESQGYRVRGLAPTGTAAQELRDKGITAETLQRYIHPSRPGLSSQKTFYILDEVSLASTRNIHTFLSTLKPEDHVLLVGDDAPDPKKVGQHTSVEAGRVFQLLQEAGMKTAHFSRIYRQKTEELKNIVVCFRHGQTEKAIELLAAQNRVHEYASATERFARIATDYALSPKGTLVVSPDNSSRTGLNEAIRTELRKQGLLSKQAYELFVLVGRDMTTADTTQASAYRVGDAIRYRRGNKEVNVKSGESATILARDTDKNRITVKTEAGNVVTYDPGRASGVDTFEQRLQEFSAGERVQFLTKDKKLGTNTRDTGTLRSLDEKGNAELVLDRNNRVLKFNLQNHRQLDHAYSMTSHSAQSKTVRRVLVNIDTSDSRLRGLINEVFGYVGTSRAEHDIQVYADDKTQLARVLSRENEEQSALSPTQAKRYQAQIGTTLALTKCIGQQQIQTEMGIEA